MTRFVVRGGWNQPKQSIACKIIARRRGSCMRCAHYCGSRGVGFMYSFPTKEENYDYKFVYSVVRVN
jgi:hypothetical protein